MTIFFWNTGVVFCAIFTPESTLIVFIRRSSEKSRGGSAIQAILWARLNVCDEGGDDDDDDDINAVRFVLGRMSLYISSMMIIVRGSDSLLLIRSDDWL